jgi:ABC-type multidrug transport system fused ATPase/permease subunit
MPQSTRSSDASISEVSDHTKPVAVTKEEETEAKGTIYSLLFSSWQTRVAIIPSVLLGLPHVLFFAIMSATLNILVRGLTDKGYDGMGDIEVQTVYLFLLACANGVCKFFDSFFWMKAGSALSVALRRRLFEKMMRSEVTFFDTNPIGGILTLLSEDARLVQDAFGPIKGTQIQSIGTFISAIVAQFFYSWKISLIYLASFVAVFAGMPLFGPGMERHSKLKSDFTAKTMTIAEEAISSIRTVRSFNREDVEFARYSEANRASQHHDKIVGAYLVGMVFVMFFVVWGSIIGLFYYGITLLDDTESGFDVGALFACFGFQMMGDFTLLGLQQSFEPEEKAITAGSRILKLTRYAPKIPFEGGEQIPEFRGRIEFRNVSFKYPTRDAYVLKNVSFTVEPGQIAALVGHSGSGKSTCVQLIERFYDPTEGTIFMDGRDITTLDPRWLHRKIGLVAQEPVLFQTTIRENILYGNHEATEAEILEAAEIASARKFIEKFPRGFEEMVGEKGTALSGGQRQRVAIARAVVKNPVVLVTDEATSALDAASEKKVQSALNRVMVGRTAVVVAHRLSTIRNAGIIYVFDQGEIRETGTHEDLVRAGGCYYGLVQRQLVADAPAGAAAEPEPDGESEE